MCVLYFIKSRIEQFKPYRMKHRIGIIDGLSYFRAPSDTLEIKYRYITLCPLYFNLARTIYSQAGNTRRLMEKEDNRKGVKAILDSLTKAYNL